ncbi:PHD-finger family protein [Dirofilaria immitis]|nr:PHD-finger family protein [Dirofilaria immitis]
MYNSAEDLQNLKTTEKVEQAGKINGEEQTHCLCGSSDESSFMICCDHCGIWYHGACLQVTRTQANRIETYACPPCISKNNNLKIVYRVPKKEQEKSVHREKRCKSRSARNDIKTRNGPRHSSKDDHEESKTGEDAITALTAFDRTTDDDDDDNTETLKQESGSIRSGFAASGAKKPREN